MLSHEWRELEALCERIGKLRLRFISAQRTQNVGLIAAIKDDIDNAERQRELIVRHISTSLGSAAASRPDVEHRQTGVSADDGTPSLVGFPGF
jgi:hypothetical protein